MAQEDGNRERQRPTERGEREDGSSRDRLLFSHFLLELPPLYFKTLCTLTVALPLFQEPKGLSATHLD